MSKKSMYKCSMCDGLTDHIATRYDSSPRGDDELVCPLCGAVECGFSEVEVDDPDTDKEL